MKILLLVLGCLGSFTAGKVYLSRAEALDLALGKGEKQHTTHYWTKQERAHIAALATAKHVAATRTEYRIAKSKRSVWFDTRRVRSKSQTLMVVVDATQKVKKLVLCAFQEPLDFKPSPTWYAQFEGHPLDAKLQLKQDIHGISGATLSARATTRAVREILASHAEAHPVEKKKKTAKPFVEKIQSSP